MVEHSGETSGEYELFHGSEKGEKRGGGVGHFCQNYPEITCFLRVRDGFRVTTRETFGNPTSLERRINLSSQIYSSSSSRVTFYRLFLSNRYRQFLLD